LVSWSGIGSYGVVYRVEKVGQEAAGPFALKLARHPQDPRFEREGELISRLRHRHVPRLEDRGWLTLPGGVPFPYVVMEWVEGVSLYKWFSQRQRTSRDVLRVLGQVARALEATHAAGGVHRDVKGDNVLVRAEDGTAVLMDFGSGNYRGAPPLTRRPPSPGTPEYRSPECLRFHWKWQGQPEVRYEAGPADDVYALGVMAYRLVTGVYPPPGMDFVEMKEGTELFKPEPVPVETRVWLSPELAALIARMLSDEPTERGSVVDLAMALEHAASTAGPKADLLIVPVSAPAPSVSEPQVPAQESIENEPRPVAPRDALELSPWLAAAAVALLVLGAWWTAHRLSLDEPTEVAEATRESGKEGEGGKEDAGTVGLGGTVPSVPASVAPTAPVRSVIGMDMPKNPLPGQGLPPCENYEVEINGGCWVRSGDASPPCGARSYAWRNKCYSPSFEPPRPTTSDPP
jgi:predicted Ser/Thr protein kinase